MPNQPLSSILFSTQAAPKAMSDLGLGGSETPEEIALRKKKLLAAGSAGDAMTRYAGLSSVFGPRAY